MSSTNCCHSSQQDVQHSPTSTKKNVPLAVKIAPDLTEEQIDIIADLLPRHVLTVSSRPIPRLPAMQCKVKSMLKRPGWTVWCTAACAITRSHRRLRAKMGADFAIIGVGGIMSGQHAAEKMAAGANAVQVYTGLIYRGPGLVGECAREIGRQRR